MATVAQPRPGNTPFLDWFPAFLRSELAPYPGRAAAVTRITIAVVITFILVTTFQIPGSAVALYLVFIITRDSPTAAVRSAWLSILVVTVALAFSMLGVWLLIDWPFLHFLFTLLEFTAIFWLTRVLAQPSAAATLGLVVYNVSVIWTLPYPPNRHVEASLWLWLSIAIGTVVAAMVEVFFVRVDPIAVLLRGIDERLDAAQALFKRYTEGGGDLDESAEAKKLVSLAIVGTGGLRRQLRSIENGHALHIRQYLAALNSAIALTGRVVDLTANVVRVFPGPIVRDHERLLHLVDEIEKLRQSIGQRLQPDAISLPGDQAPSDSPLLPEIERTVALIPVAFTPAQGASAALVSEIDEAPKTRLLVADAFTNPEYVRFALKGSLAAAICLVLYTAVDWPGISTSVLTCLLTALSTLGASKQKQFLRIGGAVIGGVLAVASLVFLLPHMDRITNVALLIAAVSAAGGWIATSSPRLSYLGLQTCLAFYITTLQDFGTPTSLAPARDRFVGVLLGLIVMWIVGDNLWPTRAIDEMRVTLRRNVQLLAQFVRVLDDIEGDRTKAIPEVRRLREMVNTGFQNLQASAGTVRFEFGVHRAKHLAAREETLRLDASVRTAFLLDLSILQYRIQLNTHEIPDDVRTAMTDFNLALAQRLVALVDGGVADGPGELATAEQRLDETFQRWYRDVNDQRIMIRAHGILSLSHQLVGVLEKAGVGD